MSENFSHNGYSIFLPWYGKEKIAIEDIMSGTEIQHPFNENNDRGRGKKDMVIGWLNAGKPDKVDFQNPSFPSPLKVFTDEMFGKIDPILIGRGYVRKAKPKCGGYYHEISAIYIRDGVKAKVSLTSDFLNNSSSCQANLWGEVRVRTDVGGYKIDQKNTMFSPRYRGQNARSLEHEDAGRLIESINILIDQLDKLKAADVKDIGSKRVETRTKNVIVDEVLKNFTKEFYSLGRGNKHGWILCGRSHSEQLHLNLKCQLIKSQTLEIELAPYTSKNRRDENEIHTNIQEMNSSFDLSDPKCFEKAQSFVKKAIKKFLEWSIKNSEHTIEGINQELKVMKADLAKVS